MFLKNKKYHFIGIGGSGMAPLAGILSSMGCLVSGSDLKKTTYFNSLEDRKIKFYLGHDINNVDKETDYIVVSSAIKKDNPEYCYALEMKIPIIHRGELLAKLLQQKFSIAVSGSHGKTSVTGMVGEVLLACGTTPSVYLGGISKKFGAGFLYGEGEYFVAETDESDKSFRMIHSDINILTNIDREHLENYESESEHLKTFVEFINSTKKNGIAILCFDDAPIKKIYSDFTVETLTYGFDEGADLRVVKHSLNEKLQDFEVHYREKNLGTFSIPLPGRHFVLNSLAAIAVSIHLRLDIELVRKALSSYQGVGRRSDIIGVKDGVTYIDDYAHHPTEIIATISGLKEQSRGKLHVVFQPHRYSRTKESFKDFIGAFEQASSVSLIDTFSAGEAVIEGYTARDLFEKINHIEKFYLQEGQLKSHINNITRDGDCCIFMGAGSISAIGRTFISSSNS